MEGVDDTFRQHKNYFQHFLESEGNYAEKIRCMMSEKTSRLILDLDDLRHYDRSVSEAALDTIVDRYYLKSYSLYYLIYNHHLHLV